MCQKVLQYSCLENPMDRRDWQAVQVVEKSQTRLKQLSMVLLLLFGYSVVTGSLKPHVLKKYPWIKSNLLSSN